MSKIRITDIPVTQKRNIDVFDMTSSREITILETIESFHVPVIDHNKIIELKGEVLSQGMFVDLSQFSESQDKKLFDIIDDGSVLFVL